jgi:AcrR family transcriptional regulator
MNIGKLDPVSDQVKRRRYRSALRAQGAAATRQAVLASAQRLFTTSGYAATSVADIAAAADVNIDTVYATVGRKPQLLLAVIDMTLGGSAEPIPAEQRDWVEAIRAAPTAAAKIATYAQALTRIMPTAAPLFEALREAAATDPECARMRDELAERRAANMALFAANLRATGQLRDDLSDEQVADVVWTTNAPEYYRLVASRGWTPETYGKLLQDMWTRLLLAR